MSEEYLESLAIDLGTTLMGYAKEHETDGVKVFTYVVDEAVLVYTEDAKGLWLLNPPHLIDTVMRDLWELSGKSWQVSVADVSTTGATIQFLTKRQAKRLGCPSKREAAMTYMGCLATFLVSQDIRENHSKADTCVYRFTINGINKPVTCRKTIFEGSDIHADDYDNDTACGAIYAYWAFDYNTYACVDVTVNTVDKTMDIETFTAAQLNPSALHSPVPWWRRLFTKGEPR